MNKGVSEINNSEEKLRLYAFTVAIRFSVLIPEIFTANSYFLMHNYLNLFPAMPAWCLLLTSIIISLVLQSCQSICLVNFDIMFMIWSRDGDRRVRDWETGKTSHLYETWNMWSENWKRSGNYVRKMHHKTYTTQFKFLLVRESFWYVNLRVTPLPKLKISCSWKRIHIS